jgi:phosphoglycerol transferase MdoB-like AlkP superfamily enzyme
VRYFEKIRIAAGYWLIWMLVFALARFAFIVYNHSLSPATSLSDLLYSAWYGSRMDMAMAAYLLIPFCVMLFLSFFFRFARNPKVYVWLTQIMLAPVILIIISDLPAYTAWGYRIDSSPLKYLQNPKEAWASVGHLPLAFIFISMIASYWIIGRLFGMYLTKYKAALSVKGRLFGPEPLILLLFTASLIIPIRGGLQLAPLSQSSVYFSRDPFANICALNATWNFLRSATAEENMANNPYEYLSEEEADQLWSELKQYHQDSIAESYSSIPHPNIILITWESLTSKALFTKMGAVNVLPCLERRLEEGLYFDNAYASGDRTDKGIVAILSGYPAQPVTSIVKMPEKTRTLPCLPAILKKTGYQTSFYYGGETEFANMKTYLLGAGFDKITDVNDFDTKDRNSKWGAHDHVVMNKVMSELNAAGKPFFLHWLTLSSHEPFETGVEAVIRENDDLSLFMNSLHYTDSVVDRLIGYCSKQDWWKETIVVISGDHGHRLPRTGSKADDFRTPVLLLGGALKNAPGKISRVVSQTGIAAGICSLTGSSGSFPLAQNILLTPKVPYAHFCFNNGFGYTQQEGTVIYDNVGKMIIERKGTFDSTLLKRGKAAQQKSFQDYLNR